MTEPITMSRTMRATLDQVWAMWTTRDGIESWWGPNGFSVAVRSLDLRPGGELRYAMTATGAEQVAFMQSAGMPLTTEASLRYVEVVAPTRLVYRHRADFVPDVAPYDVTHRVELAALPGGRVRMDLRFDRMHDEEWTGRMAAGWSEELDRLVALLGAA